MAELCPRVVIVGVQPRREAVGASEERITHADYGCAAAAPSAASLSADSSGQTPRSTKARSSKVHGYAPESRHVLWWRWLSVLRWPGERVRTATTRCAALHPVIHGVHGWPHQTQALPPSAPCLWSGSKITDGTGAIRKNPETAIEPADRQDPPTGFVCVKPVDDG